MYNVVVWGGTREEFWGFGRNAAGNTVSEDVNLKNVPGKDAARISLQRSIALTPSLKSSIFPRLYL